MYRKKTAELIPGKLEEVLKGVNAKELGKATWINPRTIDKYKRGEFKSISINNLTNILHALNNSFTTQKYNIKRTTQFDKKIKIEDIIIK